MDQQSGVPYGSPASPLFSVQETASSGRGVFATETIPKGTALWSTGGPDADVVLREYRRELCAYCFKYDRGREWKLRNSAAGFAYCSEACREKWAETLEEDGVEAWMQVEKLNKGSSREIEMVNAVNPIPTEGDVGEAWEEADIKARLIRLARSGSTTKTHRKALASALAAPPCPDILAFLLSGILMRARKSDEWQRTLALWPNTTPYKSHADLEEHTRSFLHLVSVLPPTLLEHATRETCFLLSTRDSHNSFGIRSLDDDGAEFFGYGIWASASYFNHSCSPNVRKKRVGRQWYFRASRDIGLGEELCITYLSGEERALPTKERREMLKNAWGFRCGCAKCRAGA
ncbi:SET domain-containing protein [Saccharata proteae CBS 121410]|uniref:SET domain-containing protein n=1 Tax=Saccharata proteae CBS 121410 TaxID=1314787 RepID=A0A9P4LWV3_9PEZI|nr:SET domain-containing protein [Saccharata proteae CBS 121410]